MLHVFDITAAAELAAFPQPRLNASLITMTALAQRGELAFLPTLSKEFQLAFPSSAALPLVMGLAQLPNMVDPAFGLMRDVMSECPDALDPDDLEPGVHIQVIAKARAAGGCVVSDESMQLPTRLCVHEACKHLNIPVKSFQEYCTFTGI